MKRRIIIEVEDSYIEEDTGKAQTLEEFENTVSTVTFCFEQILEKEIGELEYLGFTVAGEYYET